MSFQYYTKPLEDLQNTSKIIMNNFSNLIGCKDDSYVWSPAVGYNVCSELSLNGSSCANLSDEEVTVSDIVTHSFSSAVTSDMKTLWYKALHYDTTILDVSSINSLKVSTSLDPESKLKICISQSKEYNSTIYEAIKGNVNLEYIPDYRRLMWILLATYAIRYKMYNFSKGIEDTLSKEDLSDNFLNTVVRNIEYEKYSLSICEVGSPEYEYSTSYISQQLSILMKNVKQLQMFVLNYIR